MKYNESEKAINFSKEHFKYFLAVYSIFNVLFDGKSYNDLKKAPKIEDSIRLKLAKSYNKLQAPQYTNGKNDLEFITSDFLIDNIETAFDEWETPPLLKNMGYDEFKEVILPYRTTTEHITLKRSELRKIFRDIFQLNDTKNIYEVIAFFNMYIDKMQRINYGIDFTTDTGLFDLLLQKNLIIIIILHGIAIYLELAVSQHFLNSHFSEQGWMINDSF